jgi:hypothetical protein
LLLDTDRFADAEPVMRRTLAIDETNHGPDHPGVAIDLNHLARLLLATDRVDEAERLMRRHVEIFLRFERRSGHPHPHLETAFANYADLLRTIGRSKSEITTSIDVLVAQYAGDTAPPTEP